MSNKSAAHAKAAALPKVAVDSEAKSYWQSYYEETGYGEIWVREIPKKVTAELKVARKASVNAPIDIRPITTVISDDRVSLEGIARFPGSRVVKAFEVQFDHTGNVLSFESVDVEG